MRWGGMSHAGGREVHVGFWLGDWKERDDLEDLGVDGRIILKWIFQVGGWGNDLIDVV